MEGTNPLLLICGLPVPAAPAADTAQRRRDPRARGPLGQPLPSPSLQKVTSTGTGVGQGLVSAEQTPVCVHRRPHGATPRGADTRTSVGGRYTQCRMSGPWGEQRLPSSAFGEHCRPARPAGPSGPAASGRSTPVGARHGFFIRFPLAGHVGRFHSSYSDTSLAMTLPRSKVTFLRMAPEQGNRCISVYVHLPDTSPRLCSPRELAVWTLLFGAGVTRAALSLAWTCRPLTAARGQGLPECSGWSGSLCPAVCSSLGPLSC